MEKSKDFERFGVLMGILGEGFDKEITPLKIELYFDSLKDFPIEEVEQSVYLAVKTLKFFPKVAELRELIEGDPDSEALMVWQWLIDTRNYYGANFKFDSPIIPYCVNDIFGDYQSYCEKTMDELKWELKRFIDLYKLVKKRPDLASGASPWLKGLFAVDNTEKGFLKYVPPVKKIETGTKQVPQIETPKPKELPKEV